MEQELLDQNRKLEEKVRDLKYKVINLKDDNEYLASIVNIVKENLNLPKDAGALEITNAIYNLKKSIK